MTRRRMAIGLLGAVAFSLTFLLDDYTLFQLSRVICIGIAVIGLNLLTGHAGLISAGQGAIFGLGAYTTVVLMYHLDLPYPLAVLSSTLLCLVFGLLLGLPALRIKGIPLVLVTLSLTILFPPVVKRFDSLTGGNNGLGITQPQAPFRLDLVVPQWLYILDLAVLGLVLLVMGNLLRSRYGRALSALRTSEPLALSVGVAVRRTKIVTFGISAALAGLGGGLYLLLIAFATADTFGFALSLGMIFAVVVGGVRSWTGSLLGAAFVVFVPDYTAPLGDRGPQLVYAVALLLTVYLFPTGLAGIGQMLVNRFRPAGRDRSGQGGEGGAGIDGDPLSPAALPGSAEDQPAVRPPSAVGTAEREGVS